MAQPKLSPQVVTKQLIVLFFGQQSQWRSSHLDAPYHIVYGKTLINFYFKNVYPGVRGGFARDRRIMEKTIPLFPVCAITYKTEPLMRVTRELLCIIFGVYRFHIFSIHNINNLNVMFFLKL